MDKLEKYCRKMLKHNKANPKKFNKILSKIKSESQENEKLYETIRASYAGNGVNTLIGKYYINKCFEEKQAKWSV